MNNEKLNHVVSACQNFVIYVVCTLSTRAIISRTFPAAALLILNLFSDD